MKRFVKWGAFALPIGVLFLLGFSSCVSFRISEEKARTFFEGAHIEAEFRDYKNEARTMYRVAAGDPQKPMVLFVHGSPGSWNAFQNYLVDAELLNKAYLVSVDRPGFGFSGYGEPETSLQKQAADIVPILQSHQGGPRILVGHSFGGPVIARIAMDYPHLVDGLVMIAPSIDPNLEETKWYQIPADWALIRPLIPTELDVTNQEILPLKKELEKMLPLWPKITAPTVVIQGEKDGLVPPGNADFAAEKLSQVTIVREPDLNHFIPWTAPGLIKEAIFQLLETTRTARIEQGP